MIRVQLIHVMGVSGSGKTTTAKRIADRLGVPHIEMDAINWQPGWQMLPTDQLRTRVAEVVAGDSWVIDGNYREARDLVWGRAQMVVFLDLPLITVLRRLLGRTVRRAAQRETLWAGNRENLRTAFLSRDSLILYALRTRKVRRREFEAGIQNPAFQAIEFRRLRSQPEIEAFFSAL